MNGKRHTACRVASARYADLFSGGYPISGLGEPHLRLGGTPSQVSGGGTPSHVKGVPHPRSRGYPSQVWGGTPSQVGGTPLPGPGGTPSKVRGGTHTRSGGYPSQVRGTHPRSGGYPIQVRGVPTPPPPPRKCEQTENITFPHPSDAGGNKLTQHLRETRICTAKLDHTDNAKSPTRRCGDYTVFQ